MASDPLAGPQCLMLRGLVLVLLLIGTTSASPASLASSAPPPDTAMIRYHVSLPARQAHRVHVRMEVDAPAPGDVDLSMAVWTPGSYLVREFARNVLDLEAHAADGSPLAVTKHDKNTWRVTATASGPIVVTYQLHANELSVRTNHVDSDHAFLSPASTFLRVDGRADEEHAIFVETPADWEVFTGLPRSGDHWVAADFDVLVDTPIEVGPHRVLEFEHDGVPHRIVLAGATDVDGEMLRDDIAGIVAEVASVFRTMPFEDYTFIMLVVDSGGGGLEHLNSSVCMVSRWNFDKPDKYRGFLSLVAHEYFHAWNVKRFRPETLGPFDYDREVYTRDLWVAEGITSYIDDLSTVRAGFYDKVGTYLDERAKAFKKESERPGSGRMSMAQASHDAWIKLYRPDDNSTNSSISYYSKGALVAFMLDLRIRRLTSGQKTLGDALRLGWKRYAEGDVGFPDGAMTGLASEVAGVDLTEFFDDHVYGTVPLAPDDDLRWVGLRLEKAPSKTKRPLGKDEDGYFLEPWLGVTTRSSSGLCRVDTVLENSPAWLAGLNHDDLILAVGETRVSSSNLQERLDHAGSRPVEITFFRDQQLRRLSVQPELRRLEDWKLSAVESLTREQADAFEVWTGQPHPGWKDEAAAETTEETTETTIGAAAEGDG